MSNSGSEKTEKPTPRKIQQAREQGQVAKSNDLNGALVLSAAAATMALLGSYFYTNLYSVMHGTLLNLAHFAKAPFTVNTVSYTVYSVIYSVFWTLLPIFVMVPLAAVLSNLMQVKPLFTTKPLEPKLDKLNPINGFKRMLSLRSVIEVVKGVFKMGLVAWVSYGIITHHMGELMSTQGMDLTQAWWLILTIVGEIAAWSSVVLLIIGVADWRYQAYELEKQLRMSKQDIKDERKNQEGDPMIKNRIRQMGIQIAKNRQLAQVPMADVVITNPTHFAVAIKYDPDIAPAPVVVAKGADHFAAKIREVAKENNITMVENKPLARSLYAAVEVDSMIPPELFVAVAEVMAFVFSKNKGRHLKRKKNPKS